MKFNFKKIASVLATTVMLGSTVAFAAAAWPDPFVKDGAGAAALVVGGNNDVTDMAAATDIGAALDAKVTIGAGTVSGTGDQTRLDTSARKLYYGDAINVAKTALSSSDLPNVLADGKVMDLAGIEYKYTQSIVLGDTVSQFSTSSGDLKDPAVLFEVGTTNTDPLYNYTLSFTKNINVADSTNVQGQKIKILGVDYVIGASSTNSSLYLYGAGETINIAGGETKTVTVAGKEHTVELVGATATNTAKITVDGVSKTVTKGTSYSFAGDTNVYVKDITYQAYAGGVQTAELIVGANTLLIADGLTVKRGADQTAIQGTYGAISKTTGTTAGASMVSGFTVSIAMNKSTQDYIKQGGTFTDDVFGGLRVQFVKANPALDDSSRAKIKVSTDNTKYAYVTFTSAKASTVGEKQLTFAVDNATSTSDSFTEVLLARATLSGGAKGQIHVLENESALLNDWIVINQGDNGAILQVDDISFNSATEATATFTDAITGDSTKVTLTSAGASAFTRTGVNLAGGIGYVVTAYNNTSPNSIAISWSGSNTKTVFPRIKLKDGGWIALLAQTNVTINDSAGSAAPLLIFPDGQTTLATTGTQVTAYSTNVYTNGIIWGLSNRSSTTAGGTINATYVQNITGGGASCNFNSTYGPAILYMEPKKWNDNTAGNYICIPLDLTGSSSSELKVSTPVLNGTDSGFQTFDSDSYKQAAVDQYGAYVTYESRTNENGVATIYVPSSQMYFDLLFTADTVTQGASKIKIVKDSEVSSVSGMNLIVVGGACINTVAAQILGESAPLCGDAWAAKTGAGVGKYLIQVAASPANAQKVAVLVAGYDAAQTKEAAAKVVKDGVDASSNKATVYPLATA
jgi:hypothetical protein